MTTAAASPRLFEPGTTGWTAQDLEDSEIERLWHEGRHEIINGVLTRMPPPDFFGNTSLEELVFVLKSHLKARGVSNHFAQDADIIIDEDRVVRADAVWLTDQDLLRQREAMLQAGKTRFRRKRVLVPPTLIIESVSLGHERHDERTKRAWYAEFGVLNYWILNPLNRSIRCLVLEDTQYRLDVEGKDTDELHPGPFSRADDPTVATLAGMICEAVERPARLTRVLPVRCSYAGEDLLVRVRPVPMPVHPKRCPFIGHRSWQRDDRVNDGIRCDCIQR